MIVKPWPGKQRRFLTHYLFVGLVFLLFSTTAVPVRGDDWPQWLGPKRDGVWREEGIVHKLPKKLKYRWRTKIGAGYSGPAVANGRVFVTDRILAKGAKNPANPFSTQTAVPGKERVLCLDEKSGNILWKKEYDCPYQVSYGAGPRCTPVVSGDKVYTLGTMGDLYCLNVKDGSVVWSKRLTKEYDVRVPMWGFAGSPLVDGDLLICLVGGEKSTAVAFHKDTGKEVWRAITTKTPGYAPPMIFEIGGKRQLIIWHPEGIHALNPKTGDVYWFQRFPERGGLKAALSIPTPRYDPENRWLFITAFYDGCEMLKLGKDGKVAEVLWRKKGRSERPDGTEGLHSIMATPFIKHDHIYGVGSYGELRCLEGTTGKRLWSTRQPTTSDNEPLRWANAFLIAHKSYFFLFNELGDLIIAHLSPKGYQQISRQNILPPTNKMAGPRGRRVLWSHPAFANQCILARNDNEIVCVSLAKEDYQD